MDKIIRLFTLLAVLFTMGVGTMAYAQSGLPTRDKIEDKYKWSLTDFYKSDAEWDKDYKWIEGKIKEYAQFKGKIATSGKELLAFLKFDEEVGIVYAKIAVYSGLIRDTDLNNGKYANMSDKISKLGADLSSAASFVNPELLAEPKEKIMGYVKDTPGLKIWEQKLDAMFRMKNYMLPAAQEKLLAELSPILNIPGETYNQLNDAELPFPSVKGEDGTDTKISHGRYRSALYSNDRDYRARVYKGTYEPYNQLKGTMATLFNGRVKTRIINAEIRGFKSAREAAVYSNNIPIAVYNNLIKAVNANLQTLHRWAGMKKKVLKLDELHPYDTYASLFPGVAKTYTFDEAKEMCIKALAPLGEEYAKALRMSFDNRWIDVYETEGKRSGAYSNGCGCGIHPWILLNWNGTLDDVFTLAHELGHNMHSYFTEKNQPYHYADYTIFAAEVASTTNEALLLDYMFVNAKSSDEKLALIEKFLTNAQMTFFRQARFAEFEMIVHEKAEKGEMMNADELTKLFADLYQKYWGPEMKTDYEEGLSWARIPHLYKYDFYVFQYSTGFSAAQALSEQIIKDGQPAIDRYFKFLKAGSSLYPIDALKVAGVDMSTPAPINKMIEKMNKYLDELDKVVGK